MKRTILAVLSLGLLLLIIAPSLAGAHPGRTDTNGGHTCWTNCAKWGLKTGEYHYHNGGSSKPAAASPAPAKKAAPAPKKPAYVKTDVYINGKKQNFQQSAYIKDGTTLVPMRPIFEALGAGVQWDNSTKKVTGTKGNRKITLSVGNKKGYINENGVTSSVDLTHPAEVTNGATMVPLRFISESLGADVKWDSATKTVKITQ
ncbi:copper amine oxidase N-terminal domain-containing protein [Alkalihalobacillus oceani]|uniref:copper amine oxidase N-terminal domain-containing protein n=1 Tax=Halalkalibacter oceani TaxID=1653776 RepID=UPI00203EAC2D|nr:copper amine oxidase N-terminal domain-containing protein [Halalkalibacter oceani]MCM3760374.1 copper amine oxidase N-terminal domain-containing protein [Halalkalibacter oceani]